MGKKSKRKVYLCDREKEMDRKKTHDAVLAMKKAGIVNVETELHDAYIKAFPESTFEMKEFTFQELFTRYNKYLNFYTEQNPSLKENFDPKDSNQVLKSLICDNAIGEIWEKINKMMTVSNDILQGR